MVDVEVLTLKEVNLALGQGENVSSLVEAVKRLLKETESLKKEVGLLFEENMLLKEELQRQAEAAGALASGSVVSLPLRHEERPIAVLSSPRHDSSTDKSILWLQRHNQETCEFREDGCSPSLCASRLGDLEVLKFLHSMNLLDVSQKTPSGMTVALFSARYGHLEVLKWLFSEQLLEARDRSEDEDQAGLDLSHFSAMSGHLEVLKWLYSEQLLDTKSTSYERWNVAHYAAHKGSVKVLKWLLSIGLLEAMVTTYEGWNIAHCAASKGHVDVLEWLLETAEHDESFFGALKVKDLDGCNVAWQPQRGILKFWSGSYLTTRCCWK